MWRGRVFPTLPPPSKPAAQGDEDETGVSSWPRTPDASFKAYVAESEARLCEVIRAMLQELSARHEAEVGVQSEQASCFGATPRGYPVSSLPSTTEPRISRLNSSGITSHPRGDHGLACPPIAPEGAQGDQPTEDAEGGEVDGIISANLDCFSYDGGYERVPLADHWLERELKVKNSDFAKWKTKAKRHQMAQYEVDIFANTDYASQNYSPKRGCWYQTVNPASMWNLTWRFTAFMLLVLDWLMVPMLVFDLPDDSWALRSLLYIAFVFWTLDVPLSCVRGYVTEDGDVEMKPKKVFRHYRKGMLPYDLILVVIEWVNLINVVAGEGVGPGGRPTGIIRVLKFMRLLKVTKVTTVYNNFVLQIGSVHKVGLVILLTQHILACGWHWIAGVDEGFWFDRYVEALIWTISQMGFSSDLRVPATMWERIYSICVSVISAGMLTTFIGSIVTEMARTSAKAKIQHHQDSMLHNYLRLHLISWELRNRIWSFLTKRAKAKKYYNTRSVELIKTLPPAITLELEAQTYIPYLTQHPFFGTYAVSGVSSYPMHLVFEQHVVSELTVVVEHELFSAFTPATHMYFQTHGQLYYRASRNKENRSRNSARGSINMLFNTNKGTKDFKIPTVKEGIMRKLKPMSKRRNSSYDSSTVVEVRKGDWLCEAALWLRWTHKGVAAAKTDCELIKLEAERFQQIMMQELPEAHAYAQLYQRYAVENLPFLDDVFYELSLLQEMAKEVFQPPMVFSIEHCRPTVEAGHSEWHPMEKKQWHLAWESAWREGHTKNTSAMISTLTKDMKHDIILVYQTLFAQNLSSSKKVQLSKEERSLHDQRVLFLKRLIFAFAVCGLKFTTEENGIDSQEVWPYPIAAALCHGCRILVHLNEVSWRRFLNTVLMGQENAWNWEEGRVPAPFYARRAASHGVRCDSKTGLLQETRLHGVAALGSNHLGMDLPVGGLGNPTPRTTDGQLYVGPSGVPFKKGWISKDLSNFNPHIQHGHLYLRWDEFGVDASEDGPGANAHHGRASAKKHSTFWATPKAENLFHPTRSSNGSNFSWSANLECWLPLNVVNGEGWTEIPPVNSEVEMKDLFGEDSGGALDVLHRLWAHDKELCVERRADGRLRCRGLLVQLALIWAENGGEKYFLQTGATAQNDPSEDDDLGDRVAERVSFRMEENIKPTLICPRHESWTSTVARFFRSTLGLSDTLVPSLLAALQEGPEPYMYRSAPLPSVCYRHTNACPSGIEVVYDILHLSARLPPELPAATPNRVAPSPVPERTAFDPLFVDGMATKERSSLSGFSQCIGSPGTVTRDWAWLPRQEVVQRGIAVNRPDDSFVLVRTAATRRVSSLLLGIESSAPMKTDLFGNKHGVDAVSKSTTAFGKRKWRDYAAGGAQVPADLGGLHMDVSELSFQRLHQALDAFHFTRPSDGQDNQFLERELHLFRALLESNCQSALGVLEEHLGVDLCKDTASVPL